MTVLPARSKDKNAWLVSNSHAKKKELLASPGS